MKKKSKSAAKKPAPAVKKKSGKPAAKQPPIKRPIKQPVKKPIKQPIAKKIVVAAAVAAPAGPPGPVFADVKAILDRLVANRSPARMQAAHGDNNFGWATLAQLKAVVVCPNGPGTDPAYPLIDPALVGNGKGVQTNLVIALAKSTGVDFNGQMPLNGPYAAAADIQTIVKWIDAGMPA